MTEIILYAAFCFTMVFALLAALYGLLNLSTFLIRMIEAKSK